MDTTIKLHIAYTLWREGYSANEIALRVDRDRVTIYRWIKRFRYRGLKRTIHEYNQAKRGPRNHEKTSVEVKLLVYEIRHRYANCCGQKIAHYLEDEYGIHLSVDSIYRILRDKYKLSSHYKQKKYGEAPKGNKPLEVIQCDTVDFGELYAHTSINTFTRKVSVVMVEDLTALQGYLALQRHMDVFNHVTLLQSDGGPEFKGEFRDHVYEYADEYRESRAYKKNEQSFIESFNRTLRKE